MLLNILRALIFALTPGGRWGLPVILWGKPGTGKTSLVEALGLQTSLHYYRLSPAERGEGQFGVVPVPHTDGMLHYPPPSWSANLANGGLLFLDEINTAVPALQAPLLGLVQLRILGEHTFSPRTRIIGAANETQDAAGGWDLAPALANRFGHLDYEGLEASDWAVGLLGCFATDHGTPLDALKEEQRVLQAWPTADASARGLIAGFIQRRPELLHKQPGRADKLTSRAWPSRRSVEYASIALASAKVQGLTEAETDTLLGAFVGDPWVAEFAAWRAAADLPNPEELLDRKVAWAHDSRRLDRTLATLGACAALVVGDKTSRRQARADVIWQMLGAVIEDAPDVAIPAARTLLVAKVTTNAKDMQKVLNRLLPILKASGIVDTAAKAA